jgi:hypothetical protein
MPDGHIEQHAEVRPARRDRLPETAVFVITNEMIRRSGAKEIPGVLRMVPGVEVAKIDSNIWAITVRGFNGRFANKLLVRIDGREVYTPLFAGVFWGVQDVLLEDVERIEVIRGPGATVCRANAVNGVINIITKNAKNTQEAYVEAGAGTYEQGFNSARYGGQVNEDLFYRLDGKWFERAAGCLGLVPWCKLNYACSSSRAREGLAGNTAIRRANPKSFATAASISSHCWSCMRVSKCFAGIVNAGKPAVTPAPLSQWARDTDATVKGLGNAATDRPRAWAMRRLIVSPKPVPPKCRVTAGTDL